MDLDQVRSAGGLQRYLMTNLRSTGRALGLGGQGSAGVELTTDGGLITVGKAVHVASVADLVQELALLFDLRHPNIIQYLGLYVSDSGSTLIVMEYLPDSLDHLLQKMTPLSLAMKYSILCDIWRGLEYLHCRISPVIHGKLTASNVLLTSAMKAKISDVSEFSRSSHSSAMDDLQVVKNMWLDNATFVVVGGETPRELSYLSPEVQDANRCSSVAVDLFSFGQLSLYTLLQEFPTPTALTYIDINNPEAVFMRTEIQRRASYLQQLSDQLGDTSHPAVKLVNQCLQNDPDKRPSIQLVASYLKEWTVPSDSYHQMTKLELVVKMREMEVKMRTEESRYHEQLKEYKAKLPQKAVEVQQLESDTLTTKQAGASGMCEQAGPSPGLCEAELSLPSVLTLPMVPMEVLSEKAKSLSPTVQHKQVLHVQPTQLLESAEFKPFTCTYCEANFAHHDNLKVHERIHTGEKPYACSKCSAKFTQSGSLKTHLRTHTGERPFICKECPATFVTSGGLKKHMCTHSGVKPFSCLHCGMAFAMSHNLKSHIRAVHPEVKGLFCTYCDARFSNPATLKQHYRTHTGDKPFYCSHCEARFSESLALRQHQCNHTMYN